MSLALKASTEINEEIKKKLKQLVAANRHLDEGVAVELNSIHDLIDIKQHSKAILAIAKVIEKSVEENFPVPS